MTTTAKDLTQMVMDTWQKAQSPLHRPVWEATIFRLVKSHGASVVREALHGLAGRSRFAPTPEDLVRVISLQEASTALRRGDTQQTTFADRLRAADPDLADLTDAAVIVSYHRACHARKREVYAMRNDGTVDRQAMRFVEQLTREHAARDLRSVRIGSKLMTPAEVDACVEAVFDGSNAIPGGWTAGSDPA